MQKLTQQKFSLSFSKVLTFMLAFPLTFISNVQAHEKTWPEKRLKQAWSTAQNFTSKQITLSSSQISILTSEGVKIGPEDRSPTFYFAQEKDPTADKSKTLGVIFFVDAYGANGLIEISVAMSANGQVNKVDIWNHSENSLIAKEDFLKQFIGKTAKDSFTSTKDYTPVSGADKASTAIAKAVEKALKITNIVFEKK